MTSFLDKIKKGMGVENTFQKKTIKEPSSISPTVKTAKEKTLPPISDDLKLSEKQKEKSKKRKKAPQKKKASFPEKETVETVKPKKEKIEVEEKKEIKAEEKIQGKKTEKREWFEPARQNFALQNLGGPEGELTIDVYQTNGEIVIQSAIAGVKPEDLDITIEKDMVTIKGNREKIFEASERNYFHQECYWGRFSRKIILPVEVNSGKAEAIMKDGILTIRIPKIEREKRKKIVIKE